MAIDRKMSGKTWKQIYEQLDLIVTRAQEIKANDIYMQANRAKALMRNLSDALELEDRQAVNKQS
jgi:hypothetical protein